MGIMTVILEYYFIRGSYSLHIKCPYLELFWSLFSGIRNEYRELRNSSLYLVQMRENTDHKNSEYGHFLRSDYHKGYR